MNRLPLFSVLVLSACVTSKVGSGVPATVEETFLAVDGVSLETFIDTTVTVVPGASQATVSITCDDNLFEFLFVEVQDGVLVIRDEAVFGIVPTVDCHAEVEVPALTLVAVTGSGALIVATPADGVETIRSLGSGSLSLGAVTGGALVLEQAGSGAVTVDALTACSLDATIAGSGAASVRGTADSASISLLGSGAFGDAGFAVGALELWVTGSGSAEVTALQSAKVTLTGSGSATVYGNPQERDVDDTGSGSVQFE